MHLTEARCLVSSSLIAASFAVASPLTWAADYALDPVHSFVSFRISHLGVSMLQGRFDTIDGAFTWDKDNPSRAKVDITIKTASVNTNHAERDKHIRGQDFLDIDKYPEATFESTGFSGDASSGTLTGDLTLHGVTRPVSIAMTLVGEGPDPWGGYRAGFSGSTSIKRSDFGISYDLGPAAESMQFDITIEGVRK